MSTPSPWNDPRSLEVSGSPYLIYEKSPGQWHVIDPDTHETLDECDVVNDGTLPSKEAAADYAQENTPCHVNHAGKLPGELCGHCGDEWSHRQGASPAAQHLL